MKLLFFIPTFNDQDGLVELVRSLVDMHPMSTILIVDDGSKQAIEIPNIGSNVLLHRLPTNMGLGVATSVALDFLLRADSNIWSVLMLMVNIHWMRFLDY